MVLDRRNFLAGSTLAVGAGALPNASSAQVAHRPGSRPESHGPDKVSDRNATAIRTLSRHAAGLRYADVDAATIGRAKRRVLDVVGCAIAGAVSEKQSALADMARAGAGVQESSLIGFPVKTTAAQAALVNAVSTRAWDFEVMTVVVEGRAIESHHSPTTAMTALALCERGHLTGRDFLTALTLGDDLSARVLAATGVDFGQGWSPAPLFASWGATAIAGRLMGLDAEEMQNAFGMSTDQIGTTQQTLWDATTNWKLAQGLVARNAIVSAELAKAGWSGMNDALGAPFGFYNQFTAGCARPEILTRDLGRKFWAEEHFKAYPQCGANHVAIEAALTLRAKSGLRPEQIDQVTICVQPALLDLFMCKPFKMEPYADSQAIINVTFAVATALRHGSFRQEHYGPVAIRDPQLRRLIVSSRLAAMPQGEPGVRIDVRTVDGKFVSETRVTQPDRHPNMGGSTDEQVIDKFRRQVAFAGYVPSETAERIIRRVAHLDEENDMADFVRLVTSNHV